MHAKTWGLHYSQGIVDFSDPNTTPSNLKVRQPTRLYCTNDLVGSQPEGTAGSRLLCNIESVNQVLCVGPAGTVLWALVDLSLIHI